MEETKAMAYLELGEEKWTLDHNGKVLGKAAAGEAETLLPIVGMRPGTLMIGEIMETENGDTDLVDYLAEILDQIEARGMAPLVTRIDMSDPRSPEFDYGGKYTVVLGRHEDVEHKFGMFVTVLDMLKEGDVGVIDVSSGRTAHFSPN